MEEEIIENPSTLCRICLNAGSYELSATMTIDNERVIVEEMLKEFSSVEGSDNIPSMLCSSCAAELTGCYTFLKKVQRADEYIKHLFDPESQDDFENKLFSLQEKPAAESPNIDACLSVNTGEDIEELDFIAPILRDEDTQDGETPGSLNSPGQSYSAEEPKVLKRPARGNKKPVIFLTENVSNLLSRVRKSSIDDLIEEMSEDMAMEGEPPIKRQKPSGNSSLIVTKFVLQPFSMCDASMNVQDSNREQSADHEESDNSGSNVNRIQTIDMAAVEIDANAKISAEEIDDDTNIEDPSRIYMCKHCPKAFSTSHHLLMHSRKSHICHFCTQSFAKVEDLHRHSREAHTSFKCSLCEKEFSSNSNLRQHIKRVHKIDLPAFVSLLSVKRNDGIS